MNETRVMDFVELNKITGKYKLIPAKSPWTSAWLKNQDQNQENIKVGKSIFDRAYTTISPEVNEVGLPRTGMTNEQAREFEVAMNQPLNSLNPYNKQFWGNHNLYVKLPPDGLIIDCDRSPKEKLQYLYLMASKKVAKSKMEALENPLCEWILTSDDLEAKKESQASMVKRDAYKKLETLSLDTQVEFLSIYASGKHKVSNSKPDFINSAMGKIVEDDPDGFLQTINNPNFKDYVLLKQFMDAGLVRQMNGVLKTNAGDILGHSMEQAVSNLKAPDFQTIKISLKTKLDTNK